MLNQSHVGGSVQVVQGQAARVANSTVKGDITGGGNIVQGTKEDQCRRL